MIKFNYKNFSTLNKRMDCERTKSFDIYNNKRKRKCNDNNQSLNSNMENLKKDKIK